MTCHNVVVTGKALLYEFLHGVTDVVVNQDWFGRIEDKVGKTDPDALALLGALSLDLSSNGLVSSVVTVHAMDPDDGNISTFGGSRGHDDKFGVSDGS